MGRKLFILIFFLINSFSLHSFAQCKKESCCVQKHHKNKLTSPTSEKHQKCLKKVCCLTTQNPYRHLSYSKENEHKPYIITNQSTFISFPKLISENISSYKTIKIVLSNWQAFFAIFRI